MTQAPTPDLSTASPPPVTAAPALTGALTLAMAAACGIAVANIYYNQPMLGILEREFAGSRLADFVPTATQLGYAAGLLLLVPLGDLVDRRRLIVLQLLAIGVMLGLAALAPSATGLIAASLFIGLLSTVAQQIVPFAATLAAPEKRGHVIGVVMSGLLCGVLFSRTLGGFVATHQGWRSMFWLAMPLAWGTAALMAATLPRHAPTSTLGYGQALASLAQLWRHRPALRAAALTQGALFASFSAFWTVLSLRLEQPVFNLGADVAGLFGIIGAVGVVAAPIAGRLANRRGSHLVVGLGTVVTLLSWLLFGAWANVWAMVAGVVILDFGMQSALVSNQAIVFALDPQARSRLNTVFMGSMFLGGALGSAAATAAWKAGQWPAVCTLGGALAMLAFTIQAMLTLRRRRGRKGA
ncbi:MFS transporter [Nitrospirillum sp. BR 11163]|uniref:MFS transporter n=1 Tax=Nitrospirillum sp. BR 11163 TaxID=3104323 RepID=UPI002AFDF94E|nr:MFS transporter [Nitrospirillum sp. BR 11163]MEA1674720.1 MFS transporter [Nitrospirillum sp. BR 11163]